MGENFTDIDDIPGYLLTEDIYTIRKIINTMNKPLNVLEIGPYYGKSTEVIKQAMRSGSITCVDIWDNPEAKEYFKEHIHPVYNNGNTVTVTAHEMTSDKFFEINDETFDFIFIDGSHHYKDVKNDYENACKVLRPGGYILLHDWGKHCDPVNRFIESEIPKKYRMNGSITAIVPYSDLVIKNNNPICRL